MLRFESALRFRVVPTSPPRLGRSVADRVATVLVPQLHARDAVLLARYSSRESFSRMAADPEYEQVTELRTQALTEAVLQAISARQTVSRRVPDRPLPVVQTSGTRPRRVDLR